jgi:glyoxylase-like metal-dependent hydrolase (beta-lactamase superfamily II)
MKIVTAFGILAILFGCASMAPRPAAVERMYVISCGENQTPDLSRWTPGVNVGKPHVFGDHCYLVKHAKGWLLWDSGNPDRLAAMPNGLTNPQGTITAFMKKPLVESLKEIGVAPGDVQYFAMSHSHGDHSGNANLFASSTIFMQQAEYDAVFGAEPAKYGFAAANFEKLKGAKFVVLNGERDVFGDGSVVIKPAPGHTPGHQVLAVRLPKRGPVLLSGDMVHLVWSWQNDVVPGFNFNVDESKRSIAVMKDYVAKTGAQIWVNHDKEQHASIPKAPAYVE